jgi:hypothetical protein
MRRATRSLVTRESLYCMAIGASPACDQQQSPAGLEPTTYGLKGAAGESPKLHARNRMRTCQLAHNCAQITGFSNVCKGFCTDLGALAGNIAVRFCRILVVGDAPTFKLYSGAHLPGK